MKKFQFQFGVVLKHRQTREEAALRALGESQRAHQRELENQAMLRRELEGALCRRDGLGAEPTSILTYRIEQDFITGLKQRLVRQEQVIARAAKWVSKALRGFLLARRETKVLEQLYERHFAAWKKSRALKTQRELDDLTLMRSNLRSNLKEELQAEDEVPG